VLWVKRIVFLWFLPTGILSGANSKTLLSLTIQAGLFVATNSSLLFLKLKHTNEQSIPSLPSYFANIIF
jgi:hypothetical protein